MSVIWTVNTKHLISAHHPCANFRSALVSIVAGAQMINTIFQRTMSSKFVALMNNWSLFTRLSCVFGKKYISWKNFNKLIVNFISYWYCIFVTVFSNDEPEVKSQGFCFGSLFISVPIFIDFSQNILWNETELGSWRVN